MASDNRLEALEATFCSVLHGTTTTTLCVPKMSLLRLAITDTHGSILIIFGTNVPEKVGNQKAFYFPTSPNECFCTTWQNEERQK